MLKRSFKFLILFSCILIVKTQDNIRCGVARENQDNRIVNGRDVGFVKYSWYVALIQAMNAKQLTCGGTLISEQYVLTAAHCYKPYFNAVESGTQTFEDIYLAKIGINNICVQEEGVLTISIARVIIHEKYKASGNYYDITLLELEESVTDFTPICLPYARYESSNRTNLDGLIIGLGKEQSSAYRLPCTVKEANVPIQPDSVCKNMLQAQYSNPDDFHDAFCAGSPEGGADTCQGDSGGPLQILLSSSNQYCLLGITSFGFGCGKKDMYGMYTDVSHYLDWIEKNIETDITPLQADKPIAKSSGTLKIDMQTTVPKPVNGQHKTKPKHKPKKKSLLEQVLSW